MTVPKSLYGNPLLVSLVGERLVVGIPATKAASPPIQADRWCRNAMHPNAQLVNQLNEAGNQAVLYRTKEVARFVGIIGASGVIASSGAGDRARWKFAFHSGPYASMLCCVVIMHPPSAGTGTSTNTYGRLDISTSTTFATTASSQTFTYGAGPTGTTAAGGWQYLVQNVNYISISPDTDYFGAFYDVDYGRIQSATIFELASMTEHNSGYLPQNLTTGSAVLDVYRQNLATISYNLWRRGGATVLNWSVDNGASPLATISSTLTNLIDTTSTTVTAATPGYTIDMTGKARVGQPLGVPVVMKALAKTSSGVTSGSVVIKNSAGTTVATVPGWSSTTATWNSIAFNLPATVDKYDIQYASSGGATLQLYAVSIYEYET